MDAVSDRLFCNKNLVYMIKSYIQFSHLKQTSMNNFENNYLRVDK